jgi:peptidyl-prolyl cis-trans isomerase B (cyclophilin B)
MKKVLVTLTFLLTSCVTQTSNNQTNPSPQITKTPEPIQTVASSPTPVPTPTSLVFDIKTEYKVNMETSLGTIKFKLFNNEAPKTVENFVRLIDKKFYDGLTFHRIIPKFMIQGGDPTGTGNGGESIYGRDFEDEFSPTLKFNKKGLLAMANRGANTNTSQFFITVDSSSYPFSGLNNVHTIFGEVIEGFDILEKIVNSPRGANDRPNQTISMTKVTLY